MQFPDATLTETGLGIVCSNGKTFPKIPDGTPQNQWDQWPRESRLFAESGLTPAPAPTPPPPSYIDQRRPLYREKLAALKGEPGLDEVGVIGFQLDAIFTQLVTLAGGVGNMTPEMQAIIARVQEVKAAVPKN